MRSTFDSAARQLVADHPTRLPDLSGLTVLVPGGHVIRPMLAALRRSVGQAVFLPPRLTTLGGLAASVPGIAEVRPGSLRLAELHAFLARLDWLGEAARWPTARMVQRLLEELDDALLAPPADYGGFARQVEQAAQRVLNRPLEREARLIFELWRAFHGAGQGARADYAERLRRWLEHASGPLYCLGLHNLSRLEERFLAECGRRVGCIDLPVGAGDPDRRHLLEAVWSPLPEAPAFYERATGHAAAQPLSPLSGVVAFYAAEDIEDEAETVARQVRAWLAEGRREITIVALDRMVARRLRALLEREAILVQDETGWTFSTAAVSHVPDRWLSLVMDGAYHRDLLDLLKSPFVFAGHLPADKRQWLAALETAIREENVVAGLERFLAVARRRAPAAVAPLERLRLALRGFSGGRPQPLALWLAALLAAIDQLEATAAFAADCAGRQLLDLLRRLRVELAGDRGAFTLAQFRAWLDLQLEEATFRDAGVGSPVRLTHLGAVRLRDCEGLVLVGADAAHLPQRVDAAPLGDALRAQLGLPGRRQRRDETLAALIDGLCRGDRVLVSWRRRIGTEPNAASPWIESLDAWHRLAYRQGLVRPPPLGPVAAPALADPMAPPAPRLAGLPERLSAAGWQDLVSCPYRFFARRGLRLTAADDVEEGVDKSHYGQAVHAILQRFHGRFPSLAGVARDELTEALGEIGREVFADQEAAAYLARAWRRRWEERIDGYVDWALSWEARGHHCAELEAVRERPLVLPGAVSVTLHGRLDRLDGGAAGPAVVDYKTQRREVLARAARTPGEHVQLGFYALLADAAEAVLVGVDDVPVREHPMGRTGEHRVAEAERLARTLSEVAGGAALPAWGAPETCRWCEMRGLCRRDWLNPPQ